MIVIKVELWPRGIEQAKQEIGRMTITNRGDSMDPRRGNYDIRVMRRGTEKTVQRSGEVLDYPRLSYSIWELVRRALASAFDG